MACLPLPTKPPLRQLLVRLEARLLMQHGLVDIRGDRSLNQSRQGSRGLQQKTFTVWRTQPRLVPPKSRHWS